MDMNSSEMYHMLDDHSRERSMASLSRNAIFSITYPNPEVFLVLRYAILNISVSLSKVVLQIGESTSKGRYF